MRNYSDYQARTVRHSLAWVNGKPKHNHVDNECVMDFSCCYPQLFTESLELRMRTHERLLKAYRKRK